MTDTELQRGDAENEFLVAADIKPWRDQMEFYEACRAEIAQSAREAALLEAARAVCYFCAHGHELVKRDKAWDHLFAGEVYPCLAAAIHDLRKK